MSLSVADRVRATQQRKMRVAQAKTRRLHSRESRRRHGYQNPSSLAYRADVRKIARETWDLLVADMMPVRRDEAERLDHIEKRGDKWVLLSKTTGEVLGTHDTYEEAVKQEQAILYYKAHRHDAAGGGVRFKLYETVKKRAVPAAEAQAKRVGRLVDEDGKRVLGIDPRLLPSVGPQLDSFVIENVRLITKMTEDQHQAIFKVIQENFGLRHEELSAKLEDAFGVSESRADLIARDQTLKLAGDLTHIRQTQAGITSYVWTTSGDERVREEHALLDGETFDWSSPPEPGHPGQDYNCRCTAYPIVPGFEEEG